MALSGCDNLDFTALLDPPLTTVHIPKYEIGIEAVEALLSRMEGDGHRRRVVFAPSLVERGSI